MWCSTPRRRSYIMCVLRKYHIIGCATEELKAGEFKPEYAGKMNFYLNLLDDTVRMEDENPSIGIILCTEKNTLEVEYALKNISKPVGVAEYQLTQTLPQKLKGYLPSANEIIRKAKLYLK